MAMVIEISHVLVSCSWPTLMTTLRSITVLCGIQRLAATSCKKCLTKAVNGLFSLGLLIGKNRCSQTQLVFYIVALSFLGAFSYLLRA
jgi:hypothetical protein